MEWRGGRTGGKGKEEGEGRGEERRGEMATNHYVF